MSHIVIEHFHGAASRVLIDATASTMRVTNNVVIASQWNDPAIHSADPMGTRHALGVDAVLSPMHT
jgi:hypothetical protein